MYASALYLNIVTCSVNVVFLQIKTTIGNGIEELILEFNMKN